MIDNCLFFDLRVFWKIHYFIREKNFESKTKVYFINHDSGNIFWDYVFHDDEYCVTNFNERFWLVISTGAMGKQRLYVGQCIDDSGKCIFNKEILLPKFVHHFHRDIWDRHHYWGRCTNISGDCAWKNDSGNRLWNYDAISKCYGNEVCGWWSPRRGDGNCWARF